MRDCPNRSITIMSYLRYFPGLAPAFVFCAGMAAPAWAQSSEVSISEPRGAPVLGTVLRPFHIEKRVVSEARLTNTPRLEGLVRGGNLYLSKQDVIALVLENNLDVAIQ